MTNKKPIDREREAAASIKVGTEEDGAIKAVFPIGNVLHVIKERAIYIVRLADDIDPGRTNKDMPNIQQKVLPYGSESKLVGQTLLTAKKLFNEKFLPKSFDHERALTFVFDALKDLVALQEIATDYQTTERSAHDNFISQLEHRRSVALPAIGDVQNRCESFTQKADHACGEMLSVVKLFDKDLHGGFESLPELSERKYGKKDPFTQFLLSAGPLLTFIRDARNAAEHPKSNQRCTVTDFVLTADGQLVVPTITLDYRSRHYPRVAVSQWMDRSLNQLPEIFEFMMAYMCGKHVTAFAGFRIEVAELPTNQRAEQYVRFSYVATISGRTVPIS
jgi:hypothetical protein